MRTDTMVSKRVFRIDSISEEEGLILRTLLNLNDRAIEDKLKGDQSYWDGEIDVKRAIEIGIEIRKKIFLMVDGEKI